MESEWKDWSCWCTSPRKSRGVLERIPKPWRCEIVSKELLAMLAAETRLQLEVHRSKECCRVSSSHAWMILNGPLAIRKKRFTLTSKERRYSDWNMLGQHDVLWDHLRKLTSFHFLMMHKIRQVHLDHFLARVGIPMALDLLMPTFSGLGYNSLSLRRHPASQWKKSMQEDWLLHWNLVAALVGSYAQTPRFARDPHSSVFLKVF